MPTKNEELESARISMLAVRRVLKQYEAREGTANSKAHTILLRAFQKATEKYLRLSEQESLHCLPLPKNHFPAKSNSV
jgi:hypothetical protein